MAAAAVGPVASTAVRPHDSAPAGGAMVLRHSGAVLYRASALADAAAAAGADRRLPVAAELTAVLPGLRRGSTVAVRAGASSLVLALLAGVSGGGGWSAVVGMPRLSGLAAAAAGVDLSRLALVPHPGPDWPVVVAALLDGVDLVVVAPPGPVAPRLAARLAARARLRGNVLMPYGQWEGADLTLSVEADVWHGLGVGRGRLRWRESTVRAWGRGAAHRPRQIRVQLPGPAGRLAALPPGATEPDAVPSGAQPEPEAARRRPALTVIKGGGRWRPEAA